MFTSHKLRNAIKPVVWAAHQWVMKNLASRRAVNKIPSESPRAAARSPPVAFRGASEMRTDCARLLGFSVPAVQSRLQSFNWRPLRSKWVLFCSAKVLCLYEAGRPPPPPLLQRRIHFLSFTFKWLLFMIAVIPRAPLEYFLINARAFSCALWTAFGEWQLIDNATPSVLT